jgi:hypothetical protein
MTLTCSPSLSMAPERIAHSCLADKEDLGKRSERSILVDNIFEHRGLVLTGQRAPASARAHSAAR